MDILNFQPSKPFPFPSQMLRKKVKTNPNSQFLHTLAATEVQQLYRAVVQETVQLSDAEMIFLGNGIQRRKTKENDCNPEYMAAIELLQRAALPCILYMALKSHNFTTPGEAFSAAWMASYEVVQEWHPKWGKPLLHFVEERLPSRIHQLWKNEQGNVETREAAKLLLDTLNGLGINPFGNLDPQEILDLIKGQNSGEAFQKHPLNNLKKIKAAIRCLINWSNLRLDFGDPEEGNLGDTLAEEDDHDWLNEVMIEEATAALKELQHCGLGRRIHGLDLHHLLAMAKQADDDLPRQLPAIASRFSLQEKEILNILCIISPLQQRWVNKWRYL